MVLANGHCRPKCSRARPSASPFLIAGAAGLVAIGSGAAMRSEPLGLALLAAVAFFVISPYSLLAGAIAVELRAARQRNRRRPDRHRRLPGRRSEEHTSEL